MAGISEILVLIFLICALLILPRMIKSSPSRIGSPRKTRSLSVRMRTGIVLSILFPVISGLILKPWNGSPVRFFTIGILPVALCWGLFWIISGRKN